MGSISSQYIQSADSQEPLPYIVIPTDATPEELAERGLPQYDTAATDFMLKEIRDICAYGSLFDELRRQVEASAFDGELFEQESLVEIEMLNRLQHQHLDLIMHADNIVYPPPPEVFKKLITNIGDIHAILELLSKQGMVDELFIDLENNYARAHLHLDQLVTGSSRFTRETRMDVERILTAQQELRI